MLLITRYSTVKTMQLGQIKRDPELNLGFCTRLAEVMSFKSRLKKKINSQIAL